jgi:hypothetical protein
MTEYKKFDTKADTIYYHIRLAKDAEVVTFGDNTFAKLTVVDSSRLDSDEEMWVEINPGKFQTAIASYMEKGDEFGARGKLTFRKYGDDKFAHNLRNAEVMLPPSLIATLKERGFTPGSDEVKGSEAKAPPKKKGRPAGSKNTPKAPVKKGKTVEVDIDLDEGEAEEGEE